jgi:hypothetical protein
MEGGNKGRVVSGRRIVNALKLNLLQGIDQQGNLSRSRMFERRWKIRSEGWTGNV